MVMTAEQLLTACCVPNAVLIAAEQTNPTIPQRLAALTLFVKSEQEAALADALELINNPNAELPFTDVADWREAYLELAKRHVRQTHELLFQVGGLLVALAEAKVEPDPQSNRELH